MSFDFNYPVVELISDSERQSLQDRAKGRGEKEAEGGGEGGGGQTMEGDNVLLVAADAECSHP